MVGNLIDRIKWTLINKRGQDEGLVALAILREIETTHHLIDPDVVTDEMLVASFGALPEHYDMPDPKRRPWHAFKAVRRFAAMVRAAPKTHS